MRELRRCMAKIECLKTDALGIHHARRHRHRKYGLSGVHASTLTQA